MPPLEREPVEVTAPQALSGTRNHANYFCSFQKLFPLQHD